MTPQSWRRVGELFHQAVEIPTQHQLEWVQTCSDDPEVRRELTSLLESDREAREGFVHDKIKAGVVDFVEHNAQVRTPGRAGPYKLVREIGRGGMGTVYLGERDDEQYSIDVAVKLVTPGMDTAFVLQRFRRERQILASFDHPHIARLLDGGTTEDGLPFIVMEYVEGLPITTYCRQHTLDVEQRLRLFLDVCAAVEYAHRHFVVHRDIKPSNILVTEGGVAKLLDFGICKLLYSDPLPTGDTLTEGRMLTPDYASPEQIRGSATTIASDIYSLGAVLYEVLTGAKPHRFANGTLLEIERTICEEPVTRPSLAVTDPILARRLAGDLDTILLRTMHRDGGRRYPTVEEFAADLRRHLSNLPVKAVPDTLAYRFGKFLRRQGSAVAIIGAALAAILGGAMILGRQARIANEHLRIELATAEIRIGLLSFTQHDRARAVAAYAEAMRVAGPLLRESGPELEALRAGLTELEADLATPSQP
jgi:eukaryotic-like serine/threonine-protein kinase